MAAITAAMVKSLRETTGAGMMDCKAALVAVDGDEAAGVDWLRAKGLSKAAKKSGRIAAEGLVGLKVEGGRAVMVEVNSETDFVAKNDVFQGLVRAVTAIALRVGDDVEAIKASAHATGGTVADAIASAIATVGENMTLRRVALVEVGKGVVAPYVHNSAGEGLGRIGVLVALESEGDAGALAAIGRQVAMHVAAANPQALDAAGIAPEVLEREKGVLREKNAGKPPQVMDKIIESGLKSYYKEACLLDQAFVYEPSKSVAQAVKEAEKAVGAPIKVAGFVRYALGEGIEKEVTDFAAEVAATAGV